MIITTSLIDNSVVVGFVETLYRVALHAKAGEQKLAGEAILINRYNMYLPFSSLSISEKSMVVYDFNNQVMAEITGIGGNHQILIKERHAATVLSMMTNERLTIINPRKVSEFGIGLIDRVQGTMFAYGDLTVHSNGVIECAEQPVRKLDHAKNRRMLKELKSLFDQVLIKSKLGILTSEYIGREGARIYGLSDSYTRAADGTPPISEFQPENRNLYVNQQVALGMSEICAKFLDTGVLDPDDSVRIALLLIKRMGRFYYMYNYRDRFDRDFPIGFQAELKRMIEDTKEPLRIATGVVTFE